ncbi:hypothetical protein [Pseudoduganella umbonata]|uniref:Lipoprotein n=1 Tax=Pseudoduganella umbonata TaxID=864828 RepID=A0A4P8HQN5_9BURK|nr:hypothetical protein [Pseudoduganella umbonata]MBB3220342.1 hypothetical protein [Pseudoduganella umbonata]QCP12119.1 hypothetical protein FCL38_18125 [Pseudoduganella umbonata]
MKATYLGTAVLAAALALAGCGGKSEFTITGGFYDSLGNLVPLKNPGLVLANGDDEISVPVGTTTFSFPKTVEYGNNYNVVVKTQPQHMTCSPQSSAGVAGRMESVAVALSCTQNTYSVVVAVKGLTEAAATDARLQLINGSTVQEVTAAAAGTSFGGIPVGSSYGITIFQQPLNQTCTIANGAGIMGDADRADTLVTCTKNP